MAHRSERTQWSICPGGCEASAHTDCGSCRAAKPSNDVLGAKSKFSTTNPYSSTLTPQEVRHSFKVQRVKKHLKVSIEFWRQCQVVEGQRLGAMIPGAHPRGGPWLEVGPATLRMARTKSRAMDYPFLRGFGCRQVHFS